MSSVRRKTAPQGPLIGGLGQLTLVEHALCPLNVNASLVENLTYESEFFFSDRHRNRRKARAKVFCPLGLSAGDELYLWGLLALPLAEPEPDGELHATPHFCLRRLRVIDQHARRGGRQYAQFAQIIERLSLVRYRSDNFYDAVRAEHRRVAFGFFSYSLPIDPCSNRAWRFVWDPLFLELVKPIGGHFRFDLETYCQLDVASRRLFMVLCKIFQRHQGGLSQCSDPCL